MPDLPTVKTNARHNKNTHEVTRLYKGKRIIALVPAFNEEAKIGHVVSRTNRNLVDKLLVIDNGSTDATAEVAARFGAEVLSFTDVRGVGASLREGLNIARNEDFDVAVIMAGNNKDNPDEIPALIDPICDESCDFVIGSRFVNGGSLGGDMPLYRRIATRIHPWLMSLFVGKQLSETTNGFRAIRLEMLNDPRFHLDQTWLDGYGLEVYLLFQTLKLGYKHKEVPCTKTYPPRALGYTKMKPIIGWWNILRPIFLLGFALKR